MQESETSNSEFETKNELRYRGGKATPQTQDPPKEDKPKREAPQFLRSMPFMIKYENFFVRTLWTILMLITFMAIIYAGHFYCSLIAVFTAAASFKEILELKRNKEKEIQLPLTRFINWWFFTVGIYYFYIPQFTGKLPKYALRSQIPTLIMKYHNFTCFMLWIIGFLIFVLTLKNGFYRYQFRRFGWTHMTIFFIIIPCSGVLANIYSGLIWFVFPCLLVVANDVFAYVFGFTMGKTRLIELSPKKTWEGFIGGMITTLVFAFMFSGIFSSYQYLICPQEDFTLVPFQSLTCEIPIVFQPYEQQILGFKFTASDFQIHSMVFSLFASLIAPFGGFFASGFKRAIKVKDFAEVIPGHGGITDRMDCQFMMGYFVFLYYNQFVFKKLEFIKGVGALLIDHLTPSEQLTLFNQLKETLKAQHLLP